MTKSILLSGSADSLQGNAASPRRSAARQRGRAARLRGEAAEELAAEYLTNCGLKILARNLRCRAGELDLVCLERDILVIVEVRQRSSMDFGGALASVTPAKQRRILRATRFHWQRQAAWRLKMIRFDVLTVQSDSDDPSRIAWIRDAFRGVT
jgi:putative endonuclease